MKQNVKKRSSKLSLKENKVDKTKLKNSHSCNLLRTLDAHKHNPGRIYFQRGENPCSDIIWEKCIEIPL